MHRPTDYPTQVRYVPELTYGRPGIDVVLGRLLRGAGRIRATKVGDQVRYEVLCTEEHWQTAIWCCGVDPRVVTAGPSEVAPVARPHRPYVKIDWNDARGRLSRVARIVDGAVMWSGYTFVGGPTNGPRLWDWGHQPGACVVHDDWRALPHETRGAVLASLEFLEVPPPPMTLEAEIARGRDRRETLAALLHG
jgi:hypothetical protein